MGSISLLPGPAGRAYLPGMLAVNMYPETTLTEPSGIILVGRPRLQKYFASAWVVGTKQVNAVFQEDTVVAGKILLLIDNALYVDGVSKGTVPTSASITPMEASVTGNAVGVVVTGLQDAKFWDETTFRAITFPDGAWVTKVVEMQGRFIFLRAGSQRYYWTEPLENMIDGSGNIVIDGLDYASAENEPDLLVDALVFRDQLILGGTKTIEMHGVTGNDDLPWSPTLGSTIPKGVYSTGALTTFNNSFAWVDNAGIVRIYDGAGGSRISTSSIEEAVQSCPVVGLDTFEFEGHELLRLKMPGLYDRLFDAETGAWCSWSTDDSGFLGGRSMVMAGADLVFGSILTGELLALSRDTTGHGTAEADIEYSFRFGIPIDGGQLRVDNLALRTGTSMALTPELRWSRDRGASWGNWRTAALGTSDRSRAAWRALGQFDYPGALFECRLTDDDVDYPIYVSGVTFNEPMGGRAR